MDSRRDIGSLARDEITRIVVAAGQPPYRAAQLVRWLYGRHVRSFDEMSDLPGAFRKELEASWRVGGATVVDRQTSVDGTRKYLVRFDDGTAVETVGLPENDRLTVCYSTQAGCAMGCAFCATGRSGLTRDLVAGEMVEQVLVVADDFGSRVTNAVAMGQGEPFANYDAVVAALRFMNSKEGPGIGARHLTVSTCGLPAGIARFADEPEQFTLAVSLHSAVQATRDRLMPGVRGITIPVLRDSIASYERKTGRRPTIEFALAAGVNDTDSELAALIAFCAGLPCHVNLIPVNPATDAGLARSSRERSLAFRDALMRSGIEASIRVERGADVDAACGQLRQRLEGSSPEPFG